MFRVLFPVLAVQLLPWASLAQETPLCDPATMDCSPLIACVEETGEILRGASFGREGGALQAASDAGVVCTGTWRRSFMGLGLAEFTCTDGRKGTSAFTWFEPESGTAVGHGTFSNGATAQFWAGNNLERYFREVAPADRERMACTPKDMLLS